MKKVIVFHFWKIGARSDLIRRVSRSVATGDKGKEVGY